MLVVVFVTGLTFSGNIKAQYGVSYDVFYRELSPYGTWIHHEDYGFVWHPHHHRDFYPYGSEGYWLYTDFGWTWVSLYSWGWAPFHYGRWFYDPFYGWLWVPGYQWGAAWVTWRYCPGYYGWAPLGPDIGFDLAFSNGYYIPYEHWHFIHDHDLGRRDVEKRVLGIGGYVQYLNQSRVIDNVRHDNRQMITYHAGPDIRQAEKLTHKKIIPVKIETASSPVQLLKKTKLQIYRPDIKIENTERPVTAPKQFEQWKGVVKPGMQQIREEHHPVKQIPEQELPKQQAPPNIPQVIESKPPVKNIPLEEKRLPQEKPVIQVPKPEIRQPEPSREVKPQISAPEKTKPIQQRPLRQPVNEVQQPVMKAAPEKIAPQERPVLKQGLPSRRKP